MDDMTREEAISLLTSGPDGVYKWNRWCKVGKPGDENLPDLSGANLEGANLQGARLDNANLQGAILAGVDLSNTKLQRTNLVNADLRGASLEGTRFFTVNLTGADLRGIHVDSETIFQQRCIVDKCKINRITLEDMKNYGELTAGERRQMKTFDDVAKLRQQFSGFWAWAHLIALASFFSPYVWFVLKHWSIAKFSKKPDTVSLIEALWMYIWTGGDWQTRTWHPAFILFCISIIYNVARLVLWIQTRKLELKQETTGLHAEFILKGPWAVCYFIVRRGFGFYLFVVVGQVIYFLTQRIPAPEGWP